MTGSAARHRAKLLTADQSGNLFIISSTAKASAINIHVTKTDGSGNVLSTFDFGGSDIDTPNAAAIDPKGNLVIADFSRDAQAMR